MNGGLFNVSWCTYTYTYNGLKPIPARSYKVLARSRLYHPLKASCFSAWQQQRYQLHQRLREQLPVNSIAAMLKGGISMSTYCTKTLSQRYPDSRGCTLRGGCDIMLLMTALLIVIIISDYRDVSNEGLNAARQ
ncbi:uncharacterized protein LOC117230680 [Bombus vosnesenskii]|uniref:Uncharacterized protein LOC117230680 n=3 Tax=Pyrobombus TaxID=144703 RepID=A0A6J3JTW9_9HYME|nr:uncharacterized protein LOC117151287 [Bombus impatiens]XP_033197156.1 uncharacterized protein LOC117160497 [Bombus vancouverensis nearcticus]XP_033306289.1 uncharacterized protein LOC117208893 [Bombus bifarius]XP_033344257.1 uncharacterized protein LOC117230680 [Bombus vosnesenskii]